MKACLILTLIFLNVSAYGAIDMFIKIEGVDGESQDPDHMNEIDVLAWSWGVSRPLVDDLGGGGSVRGDVQVEDISVTKIQDKSSPHMFHACATGAIFPLAEITLRSTTSQPKEYLIIRMSNVQVTSVSTGGSGGEDRLTENITLNFGQVEYTYKEEKPDGSEGDTIRLNWDVQQGTANIDVTPPGAGP